ncbi:MAG TPA: hypothetical protein PKD68_02450 [Candidatus Saccharibacteria bacterium]|nr:hypothetical protein [Candidatus Saccharibacteria bacterium]
MEAPSHATTSIDAKLTNIRLNTVRNTAALTAVGIRADGGDWQLFDMYASSCTVFVQSAGFLQATNTHCFNGAQVASDVAFNIRSGGIFAENIYVDTIQTGITSKLANGNYASINIAVNNLFVFQYAEKPGDTNIIHSTWGSTYALNGILGSFSGSSTAHRVLRLVDSTGTPKFQVGTVVHAQNVVLQGDRDDAIRLGIYQRVQQVAISNGAHVSGGGVLIALIPPANGSEVRTQSVKFMSRPQAEDSQGHIGLYAPNSGGQFLSITLGNKYYISTSGVVLKQKTPLPNRAATYFGVKTAIMINGEQFTPVYLYSADADIGNVPTMYAEILPSNQPWLWMSNEPWETGLADASFVWTSKNLV